MKVLYLFALPFVFCSLISFSSFSDEYSQFNIFLTDEEKFDLWGSYNRGEGAVTNESPDELIYNHTCLFLSINEENLDIKKGSYNRYKKVTWVVISLLFFALCSCFTSVFFLGFYPPFIYPFFVPISIIIATGLIRSRFKWIIDLLLLAFFIVMVLLLCLQ